MLKINTDIEGVSETTSDCLCMYVCVHVHKSMWGFVFEERWSRRPVTGGIVCETEE